MTSPIGDALPSLGLPAAPTPDEPAVLLWERARGPSVSKVLMSTSLFRRFSPYGRIPGGDSRGADVSVRVEAGVRRRGRRISLRAPEAPWGPSGSREKFDPVRTRRSVVVFPDRPTNEEVRAAEQPPARTPGNGRNYSTG